MPAPNPKPQPHDPTQRHPLRAGPSPIDGRGVFALTPIPPRAKIGEVTGALIPRTLARTLARTRKKIYLVDVSNSQTLDCTQGNVLRHLNHSCGANAYLRIIRCRVEVYARHPIQPGQEITVDYGQTPHPGGMRCTCTRPNCRTRI